MQLQVYGTTGTDLVPVGAFDLDKIVLHSFMTVRIRGVSSCERYKTKLFRQRKIEDEFRFKVKGKNKHSVRIHSNLIRPLAANS